MILMLSLLLSAHATDVATPCAEEPLVAAEDASDSGPDRIELHAWGRAGYEARIGSEDIQHGPYLAMARLKARLDHADRYGVYLHLSADRGKLQLADAEVHATILSGLQLQAGRMKVPVSHDFLVPVEKMLLPTRALLDRLAPSRAIGLQLTGEHHSEDLRTRVRAGVFDPLLQEWETPGGAQLVLQSDVHHHSGLFMHGAGAVWLRSKDAPERFGDAASRWDRRLDVATGFEDDHWTLHAEALMARTVEHDRWEEGVTVMLGRRIEVEHEHHLVLEPVAAVDWREHDDGPWWRGTAAVNLHEDGWHLLQTLAWEVEHLASHGMSHRVVMQIQAGL